MELSITNTSESWGRRMDGLDKNCGIGISACLLSHTTTLHALPQSSFNKTLTHPRKQNRM